MRKDQTPAPRTVGSSQRTRMMLGFIALLLAACCTPRQTAITHTVRDTLIITPAARTDTLWRSQPRDTLVLHQDKLVLRVERQYDTLRIQGACQPDTVRVPLVRTVVHPAAAQTSANPLWWGLLLGAAAMLALILLLRR